MNNLRVVSIICPRIIRRGEVFRCGASSNALNLKKPVSIDFQLSGTDEATNKTVQIRLKNQKIDSEESKSFAFDVSLRKTETSFLIYLILFFSDEVVQVWKISTHRERH